LKKSSFVMFVGQSVCPHEILGSEWKDFYQIWYLRIF